ncbi:MAG: serine protease [Candidatus Omnitrophica bacterium]|nr:serine protease [Candidatus Omnitrophota bacterium]
MSLLKKNKLRYLFFSVEITAILFILALTIPSPSQASATILDIIEQKRFAIVAIQGLTLQTSPGGTAAAITPDGRILVNQQQHVQYAVNAGAGIIIDPSGIIVTNTHVIYGSNQIIVTLKDGTRYPAAVAYISPSYDFSLLRIRPAQALDAIDMADSSAISLGDDIVTVGNSPLLKETISGGKVIGEGLRPVNGGQSLEVIELNINHYSGDSGGPVLDKDGQLVGLLSAKIESANRACLAIPVNKIKSAYLTLVSPPQNR